VKLAGSSKCGRDKSNGVAKMMVNGGAAASDWDYSVFDPERAEEAAGLSAPLKARKKAGV